MANSESFVSPRRGGGSGAAAILTPSTAINDVFKTYDAQRKPVSDPFLDSLGRDIKEGFDGASNIYEPDKPYIAKEIAKLKDLQARALQARVTYSTHPEVYQAIDLQKQTVKDAISKSQRTQKDFGSIGKELQTNWWKYDDNALKAFEDWSKMDITTRPPLPNFKPLDSANYQEIAKKWGTKNQQGYYSIANYKDQNGVTRSGYVFNEKLAEQDWDNIVKTEHGTQNLTRFLAQATELTQKEAGDMWDTLPEDVKLEAINERGKQMFVESMRMQTPTKSGTSTSQKTKETTSLGSDNSKRTTAAYRIEFTPENGTLRRTEVLPIIGAPKVKEKSDEWIDANENLVKGTPFSLLKKEGATDETIMLRIAQPATGGRKPKFVDIPYNKNKENLQTVYGVGWESRPADWKAKMDKAVPSSSPQSTGLEPADYEIYMKQYKPAWEKYISERKKKQSAPASKAAGKKNKVTPPNEM